MDTPSGDMTGRFDELEVRLKECERRLDDLEFHRDVVNVQLSSIFPSRLVAYGVIGRRQANGGELVILAATGVEEMKHEDKGRFSITFAPAVFGTPIALATAERSTSQEAGVPHATVSRVTRTSIDIETYIGSDRCDAGFFFAVIGDRDEGSR